MKEFAINVIKYHAQSHVNCVYSIAEDTRFQIGYGFTLATLIDLAASQGITFNHESRTKQYLFLIK